MLVTSLLVQRQGGTTYPIETYLERFKVLLTFCEKENIPITLYLDKNIKFLCNYSNLQIIPTHIEDLDTFNLMNQASQVMVADNEKKNTLDYHIINNSKIELLSKTLEKNNSLNRVSWIDFGIVHIFKDTNVTLNKLKNVNNLPSGVTIPGAYSDKRDYLDYPNWRFCGGFFSGDRESLFEMNKLSIKTIRHLLPIATWEVNVWGYMEKNFNWNPIWYPGNHDDTILNFRF